MLGGTWNVYPLSIDVESLLKPAMERQFRCRLESCCNHSLVYTTSTAQATLSGIYKIEDCSGAPESSFSLISGAFACVFTTVLARLPGSTRPAMAPISDRAAATLIAGENPLLNAWAERKPPMLANTAARIATPNAPPSWRSMLTVPDALPISLGATALTTAFWAAGMASEPPMPAMISGTTNPA